MATSLTRFKGGRELQEALNKLPAQIERNIVRSGIRQGANVIRDAARENVPVDSGDLKKSIRVSTRSRRGQVRATVTAGGGDAFYAHMVEFGTKPHDIKARKGGVLSFGGIFAKSIKHPGQAPQPFMRKAIDENTDKAIRAVGEQIRKRLTKEGLNAPPPLEIDED